jgi:hypothetical protein
MAVYTIAQYQVRPSGVEKVKRAIDVFAQYVKANERSLGELTTGEEDSHARHSTLHPDCSEAGSHLPAGRDGEGIQPVVGGGHNRVRGRR